MENTGEQLPNIHESSEEEILVSLDADVSPENSPSIAEEVRMEVLHDTLRRTIDAQANSIERITQTPISALRHDNGTYFSNMDFDPSNDSYDSRKFFEALAGEVAPRPELTENGREVFKQKVSVREGTVEICIEERGSLILHDIPEDRYQEAIGKIRTLPLYQFLSTLASLIEKNTGAEQTIPVPQFETEEERELLLQKLGVSPSEISQISSTKNKSIPLIYHSGLSISISDNSTLAITYNPLPYVRANIENTLLSKESGAEIIELLGQEQLSNYFRDSISEGLLGGGSERGFSNRYGNGFAELTRGVSACIGRTYSDTMMRLFGDPQKHISKEVRTHWELASLQHPNPAIREFFSLLSQVCFEQFEETHPEDTGIIEYPMTHDFRSFRDGSCKDAETYFLTSEGDQVRDVEGVFLEKKYGAVTALTTAPISVNHVTLPKGFLVRLVRNTDGKITAIQPLRLTMFAFDQETAKNAYGWQYEETVAGLGRSRVNKTFIPEWNF